MTGEKRGRQSKEGIRGGCPEEGRGYRKKKQETGKQYGKDPVEQKRRKIAN